MISFRDICYWLGRKIMELGNYYPFKVIDKVAWMESWRETKE